MYRCGHCGDLHFSSDQARRCADVPDVWIIDADMRARDEERRGPLPAIVKRRLRKRNGSTPSERLLRDRLGLHLRRQDFLAQWWPGDCDYLVDFYFPEIELIVEVDGESHLGREGHDRHRSAVLREKGFVVARVSAQHVMTAADDVAARIAFRVETARLLQDRGYGVAA